MILGDILKVTVLDEFCIETPICCITDVFEKDADELVADGLF